MSDDQDDKIIKIISDNTEAREALSEDQAAIRLAILLDLKRTNPIAYKREKEKLAKDLKVTQAAIEDQIRLLEREGESADDVDELIVIGKSKAVLWHDQDDVGFATFEQDGHLEHHGIEKDGFQHFLSYWYGENEKHKIEIDGELHPRFPLRKYIDEATYQLLGLARREDEKNPNIRFIYHDNALWLDLGGKDWDGVRVTADGWEIVTRITAPILRGGGIRPLPRPKPGGDISDLREFANVRDDEDFVLFCGSTAALLNPFGDYTTTVFCGPAGSGKTTATLVMRGLVDPHKANTRTMTTVRDLMTGAGNTHIVGLENVRHISAEMSDAICRLNTGTGYAERKLYTNGKEFMSSLHCPVLINGIPGNLAEREDLADRVVTFNFPLLGDRFQGKDAFWRKFELAKPRLLGALLDGVVGALRVRRDFGGDNDAAARELLGGRQFRFVDYAVFAEAACQAMGFPPGKFAEAYHNNRDNALRYLAEHDAICVGIVKLMQDRDEWRGYPEQLYQTVKPHFRGLKHHDGSNWLVRDLPHSIHLLDKVHNINVQTKQVHHQTQITIRWVGRGTHFPPNSDAGGDTNSAVGAGPGNVEPEMGTHTSPVIKRRKGL